MKIRNHTLPIDFSDPRISGNAHGANLKNVDSYGNPFDSEIGWFHMSEDIIREETARLLKGYIANECYGAASDWRNSPGFIEDILDFSSIICFACSGDDAPFCFDFRDGVEPSVIWWDDVYWRRISPDLESFLRLII